MHLNNNRLQIRRFFYLRICSDKYQNMNKLFSAEPIAHDNIIALLRIVIGVFLIYHGCEVFDEKTMSDTIKWNYEKTPGSGRILAYTGKTLELLAGIFLVLGLFTRLACVIVIGTFVYISFVLGNGKVWYGAQHPFMFVLFGVLFFFVGPGAMSLDRILFKRK